MRRLDRSVDRLAPELRDLQATQDGSEVKSRALELVTDRAQNLGKRRDAFEQMRDAAADAYRAETGSDWRPSPSTRRPPSRSRRRPTSTSGCRPNNASDAPRELPQPTPPRPAEPGALAALDPAAAEETMIGQARRSRECAGDGPGRKPSPEIIGVEM